MKGTFENNISKCPECGKTDEIAKNGFLVCTNCGITKDRLYVDYKPSYTKHKYNSTIQNSIGKNLGFVGSLGSQIGYSSGLLNGVKGQPLNIRTIRKYQRLIRNHHKRAQLEGNATHLRTMIAFTRIINQLRLTNSIKYRALHLYWVHVKTGRRITNHILLIALCLLQSVREVGNKAPVTFTEIIRVFTENNHRVTNKNILKLATELNVHLGRNIRKAEDYINRIVHKICLDKSIQSRVEECNFTINQYEVLLIVLSLKFLSKLKRKERGGVQPYPFAISVIYLADRALYKSTKIKPILTQKILANAIGSAEFTIRDHVYRFLGRLYKIHEEFLMKIAYNHLNIQEHSEYN